MLCTVDGKSFTLNPYYSALLETEISRQRRKYFKEGVLEVKKQRILKDCMQFTLHYKDRYLTSWTDLDDSITVRDLIAAVCRTLDAAL